MRYSVTRDVGSDFLILVFIFIIFVIIIHREASEEEPAGTAEGDDDGQRKENLGRCGHALCTDNTLCLAVDVRSLGIITGRVGRVRIVAGIIVIVLSQRCLLLVEVNDLLRTVIGGRIACIRDTCSGICAAGCIGRCTCSGACTCTTCCGSGSSPGACTSAACCGSAGCAGSSAGSSTCSSTCTGLRAGSGLRTCSGCRATSRTAGCSGRCTAAGRCGRRGCSGCRTTAGRRSRCTAAGCGVAGGIAGRIRRSIVGRRRRLFILGVVECPAVVCGVLLEGSGQIAVQRRIAIYIQVGNDRLFADISIESLCRAQDFVGTLLKIVDRIGDLTACYTIEITKSISRSTVKDAE